MFAAPTPSMADLPFGQSEYSRIQTSSTMLGKRLVGTPESITATAGLIADTGLALGKEVAVALGDGVGDGEAAYPPATPVIDNAPAAAIANPRDFDLFI